MADLPPGVYENLITHGVEAGLAEMESELVSRRALDTEDAHDVLGRHLGQLARRALQSLRGNDGEAVTRQVELANRIAEAIIAAALIQLFPFGSMPDIAVTRRWQPSDWTIPEQSVKASSGFRKSRLICFL